MRRLKHLLSMALVILVLTVFLCACTKGLTPETDTSTATTETDVKEAPVESEAAYRELVAGLEKRGFSIDAKDAEKDILQGQRKWLTVDGGEGLSVYLYEGWAEMEKDAAFISHDSFTYDNGNQAAKIQWVSDPHFFKSENMILLYVGQDPEILTAFETTMGRQFAGLSS